MGIQAKNYSQRMRRNWWIINLEYTGIITVDGTDRLQSFPTSPIPLSSPQPRFFLFYQMDDKYSESELTAILVNWMRKRSKLIEQDPGYPNILNQMGGGPNGAEWNPSANLYLAILPHKELELTEFQVWVGEQEIRNNKYIPGKSRVVLY